MPEEKNRDVMKELLFHAEGKPAAGQFELEAFLHARTTPRITKRAVHRKKQPSLESKHEKKKTTHYISNKVFDELSEAKERIPDFLPEDIHLRVTKSGIVDSVLKELLRDLEEKGKGSLLVKLLLQEAQ